MKFDIAEFKEIIVGRWSIDNRLIEVCTLDDIELEYTPGKELKVALPTIRTMLITSISRSVIEFIYVHPATGVRAPRIITKQSKI